MAKKMTRKAMREQLYRMLFQIEFHEREELEEQFSLFLEDMEETSERDREEMWEKFQGLTGCIEQLDDLINEKASGWDVKRLPKADLTVLRLAVYEILFDEKVPAGVAVNEAVELAKQYGTDKSPRFVNGVLATIVRERSQSDES